MKKLSDEQLNRALQEAFPSVEVSNDFTLRLWRRLMTQPVPTYWRVAAPALAAAAAFGILAGLRAQPQLTPAGPGFFTRSALNQQERWDLFGNAPLDTLAGSYLSIRGRG